MCLLIRRGSCKLIVHHIALTSKQTCRLSRGDNLLPIIQKGAVIRQQADERIMFNSAVRSASSASSFSCCALHLQHPVGCLKKAG